MVDFDSDIQQYGYRPGWYESTGFSVTTIILQTGTWEFILSGTSSDADAIIEFGILDVDTGLVENVVALNLLDDSDGDNSVTAVFPLL